MRARLPLILVGLLYAVSVDAQLTGTLELVSDYRFRGISLSRERPAVQGTVVYDHPGGAYGGLFVSTVEFATASERTAQINGFFGATTSVAKGVHADLGINFAAFGGALREYDYGEIYAGVSSHQWSARIHYSPDYFGASRASLYGEFEATHPIGDVMAVFAHVGVLAATGHGAVAPDSSSRYPIDGRLGFALDVAGFNVQAAWVATNAMGSGYPVDSRQRGHTFVFTLSRAF